jgi:hypothetical protein
VFLTSTYPNIQIPVKWGLPIEVVLIGQIGHGGGSTLVRQVKERQERHNHFVNELDEPSAKVFNTSLTNEPSMEVRTIEDKTAVYTFSVDNSHPFHRHEGHRVFTAFTGSSGCYLRFSTATSEEIKQDPTNFIKQLSQVHIPGDCIFTLRFNGQVWHQFSAVKDSPAFFAISVHTDETGGQLSAELQKQVRDNQASIASLTELVPDSVNEVLNKPDALESVPTYQLSLEPGGPSAIRDWGCKTFRGSMGKVRTFTSGLASKLRGADGHVVAPARSYSTYVGKVNANEAVSSVNPSVAYPLAFADRLQIGQVKKHKLASDSILQNELKDYHQEDSFTIIVSGTELTQGIKQDPNLKEQWKTGTITADDIMERVLTSFVDHPPKRVGMYMQIRNIMVTPLKLRTSPLGCPVSSLLGKSENVFGKHRQFPVKNQFSSPSGLQTQVTLGADDKHLVFRSVVAVKLVPKDANEPLKDIMEVHVTLSNRVKCKNYFGRFYMWFIHYGHENLIMPPLLQQACYHAFKDVNEK